mgnify:CR=1 FL=1
MNILLDDLPEAIVIDGKEYPINWDHRTGIDCILDFESPELTIEEKGILLIRRLYKEPLPVNLSEAMRLGIKFLNAGNDNVEENPFADHYRLYSFEKDAGLIYAAFRQTHGVDLQKERLHWWTFLALFQVLGADTAFCTLVNLRRRVKSGEATKEEREHALKMGEAFDLPEIDELLDDEEIERAEMFAKLAERGM